VVTVGFHKRKIPPAHPRQMRDLSLTFLLEDPCREGWEHLALLLGPLWLPFHMLTGAQVLEVHVGRDNTELSHQSFPGITMSKTLVPGDLG
jgi:hypothetical protein